MNTFNGLPVRRRQDTYFIALPAEARRPIPGGCACHYCKTHLEQVPTWDTLAIGGEYEGDKGRTWTVHYPEFSLTAL